VDLSGREYGRAGVLEIPAGPAAVLREAFLS
jgi:hypothetical protein